jgi:sec-independent protein translocase protein TatB
MFDIGWSELLVVVVVAIVIVGPTNLPRLMRTFGHYVGKLTRAAANFQRQLDEVIAEGEVGEVSKSIENIRHSTGSVDLNAPIYKPWSGARMQKSAKVFTAKTSTEGEVDEVRESIEGICEGIAPADLKGLIDKPVITTPMRAAASIEQAVTTPEQETNAVTRKPVARKTRTAAKPKRKAKPKTTPNPKLATKSASAERSKAKAKAGSKR